MLLHRVSLPLPRQTLTYATGVVRRHRKKIGNKVQASPHSPKCVRSMRLCQLPLGPGSGAVHHSGAGHSLARSAYERPSSHPLVRWRESLTVCCSRRIPTRSISRHEASLS